MYMHIHIWIVYCRVEQPCHFPLERPRGAAGGGREVGQGRGSTQGEGLGTLRVGRWALGFDQEDSNRAAMLRRIMGHLFKHKLALQTVSSTTVSSLRLSRHERRVGICLSIALFGMSALVF